MPKTKPAVQSPPEAISATNIKEAVLLFLDIAIKRAASRREAFVEAMNDRERTTGVLMNSGVSVLQYLAMGDIAERFHKSVSAGGWSMPELLRYCRQQGDARISSLSSGGSANLLDAPFRAAEAALYTELAQVLEGLGVNRGA